MRYFSKIRPEQALWMASTGKRLAFDQASGGIGIFKSDDAVTLADIDAAIANRSGGVSEIGEAVFSDLLKKKEALKTSPPRLQWREELGSQTLGDTVSSPLSSAAVAAEPAAAESTPTAPAQTSKPRIGRR